MKLTILGCGTAGGTPRIGPDWGRCDPKDPRNRRRRSSVLVESADGTRILVDTGPDLRQQALDAGISDLDAVLYTHDHADHTHGIDDLREITRRRGRPMDAYADARTLGTLSERFRFAFSTRERWYRPYVTGHEIRSGTPFRVGDVDILPFDQEHGGITSLGFRFGPIAYSTDLVGLPEAAFEVLAGVRVWVVAALGYSPHPTHSHVDMALGWIEKVKPERAVITHMSAELDYATLASTLPPGVEPAYDGLVIQAR
jgi:phosphoribosyl 1,2-cyclic phosphate phosphodiesterase